MLSHAKMQLWYPKKLRSPNDEPETSTEDAPKDVEDSDGDEDREKEESENHNRRRKPRKSEVSDFIDLEYWKKEKTCCGVIFRGKYGEVMIDPSLMKMCDGRLKKMKKS